MPKDITAWSRLTRLLSIGKQRAERGSCDLTMADLLAWGAGMALIAVPPDPMVTTSRAAVLPDLIRIAGAFPGQSYLGAAPRYDGCDQQRLDRLAA